VTKSLDDSIHGSGDVAEFAPDGMRNTNVFAIHDAQDLQRGHSIQTARIKVPLFRLEICQLSAPQLEFKL
jgi:hypothetical protein